MAKVTVRENENIDDALKRWKRAVSKDGILASVRKKEFYVKPGVRRRLKSEEARKKNKRR